MPRPQFTLRALLVAMLVVASFFAGRHFEHRQRIVDRENYAASKDWFCDQLGQQLKMEREDNAQLRRELGIEQTPEPRSTAFPPPDTSSMPACFPVPEPDGRLRH